MKLQLDTELKVIRLEESVNLNDLQEILERLLPNGQWKEFRLEPTIINKWSNPIVIDRYRPYQYPWWPNTPIYQQSQSSTSPILNNQLNKGIYNLSVD